MSLAITLGMWTHVVLNAIVCYDDRPQSERSQLLAEFRLIPVVVSTLAVWCLIDWSLS